LTLEPSAADSFPAFLDYIYSFDSKDVNVTTESAVALRHLGNYFGIPSLFKCVTRFIHQDLNEQNVHIFCQEALLYHDSEIVEASMKVAAKACQELLAPYDEEGNSDNTATPSPAQLTMQMLPIAQQNKLLKYALQQSADECALLKKEFHRFKRVPTHWEKGVFLKGTFFQFLCMAHFLLPFSSATNLPVRVPLHSTYTDGTPTSLPSAIAEQRRGYVVRWTRDENPRKVCALFYFDEEEVSEEDVEDN
jgi:hypothetical protein